MSCWSDVRKSTAAIARGTIPLLGAMLSASCGDSGTGPAAPTVATIEVTAAIDSLASIGATTQFTAVAKDAGGTVLPRSTFTWSSSSASVATIGSSGVATAVANGTTTIRAQSGGKTGEASLRVAQAVARIAVTVSKATLTAIGDTAHAVASLQDAGGHPVAGASAVWQSTDPLVATVTAGGVVTALANGTTSVLATSNEVADTAIVTVGQVAGSLIVTPDTGTLVAIGNTSQLTAVVNDANGHPVSGQGITWTSATPSVASVTASGLVAAVGSGVAHIVATSGALADTATIHVTPVPTSLLVSPQADSLTALGDSVQLAAVANDANGHPISGLALTWIAADTSIAHVSTSGLVTATGNGETIVVVGTASLRDTTAIRVAQHVASITVAPALDTLTAQGDTVRLTATANDRNGHPVPGTAFTWQSSATLIATVSASGLVTAAANGTASLTAAAGGVQGASVIVVDIPGIIVFSTNRDGNWEIYSVLSDGTQLTRLTQTPNQEQDPVVSADGRFVAYTRDGDDIWIMGIDGSNQRGAVEAGISARQPSWSPDGSQLAFSWRLSGSFYDPYRVTLASGQTQALGYGTFGQSDLTWSHGDSIIAARDNQGIAVFGISHDSVHIVAPGGYSAPRFSPNGQWIAATLHNTALGTDDIVVMHPDGSALTPLTSLGNCQAPTWSPDGTRLAVVRDGELWVMNADGTHMRQVTFASPGAINHPSWYN